MYGHNKTMTGILFLPTDTTKSIIPGNIKTAIWLRGLVTTLGPSQVLPSSLIGWMYAPFVTLFSFFRGGIAAALDTDTKVLANHIGALMMASRGLAVIAPDNLGYGDDKTLYKGTGIGRVYQTSTIPLWLRSKELVHEVSGGKVKSLDICFVAGGSEGGGAVMPISQALHEMGAQVTAYPGAVPSFDLTESVMRITMRLLQGEWPPAFLSWAAYGLVPFDSSNPHYSIASNEGFLSNAGREAMLNMVHSDMSFSDGSTLLRDGMEGTADCLIPQNNGTKGCPSFLNPIITQNILEVIDMDPFTNNEFLPCQSKNPAPELSTLCRALELNSVGPLVGSAQYPVNICHPPSDNVSRFKNMTRQYPNNTHNVQYKPSLDQWAAAEAKKGSKYLHNPITFTCNMYAVLDVLDTIGSRR